MMSVRFCLLLSVLIASTVAVPWHDEKEFDSRQQGSQATSRRGFAFQNLPVSAKSHQCKISNPQLFPGNQQANFPVRICQDDSSSLGICYKSNYLKCCGVDFYRAIILPTRDVVTVGNQQVTMEFYRTGSLEASVPGACLFFPDHIEIPSCRKYSYLSCDMVSEVCVQHSEPGSCTVNGCRCLSGYSSPSCCGCNFMTHFVTANQTCLMMCPRMCSCHTVQRGCKRCLRGYKPPSCCGTQ